MGKKIYIYIYKHNDRTYEVIINADDKAEAIFLRDKLLAFYANDASRLPEMLQKKGIENSWDYEESQRKARIEEVQIYRKAQHNLQLVNEYVLSGREREQHDYGRRMGEGDQGLRVWVKGEDSERDSFNLRLKDFTGTSNYTEQVTQQLNRIIKESPELIAHIKAYVAAFQSEAGISRDPIQLKSLNARLLRTHFGENFKPGNSVIGYLDKADSEKFYSIERRIENVKMNRPHADSPLSKLPANTWEMNPLMFAVIRLGGGGANIDVVVNQAIARTQELLAQGTDINAQDVHGRTALMYIAMGSHYFKQGSQQMPGREKLTRLLLERGADPSLKDHLGKTALDYFIAEVGGNHPATQLIRASLLAKSKIPSSVSSSLPLEAENTSLVFKSKAEKSESESESDSDSEFDSESDSEESMQSDAKVSEPPALYVYLYKAGDRDYKLCINARSDAEAISLRDRLLALYGYHAARLSEMFQHQGIRSISSYEQSGRETRLQEVPIFLKRRSHLKLIKEYVLVGKKREEEYYGRRMDEDAQGLQVWVEGEEDPRDEFSLNLDGFSDYAEKVTQQIDRILTESPQLIARIEAYVAAFNRDAGALQDPIQLKLLSAHLFKVYFGDVVLGDTVFNYLDKAHLDKYYSVRNRIDALKIAALYGNKLELSVNPLRMTPLMLAVIRSSEAGTMVSDIVNLAIARTQHLLNQGVDVNARDVYGRTALMYVAVGHHLFADMDTMPGREKLTRLLLAYGADPSLKDHLGKTALDYFMTEVGENHPATQLIREAMLAKSMANVSISSSLAERCVSSGSITVGRNSTFFPASPVLSEVQNTVLSSSPPAEKANESIEENFKCPISLEVMTEPVVAADGQTYERKEIERWLKENHTSPKTNEPLPHKMLTPNWALKATIDAYYRTSKQNTAGLPRPSQGTS